MALRNAAVDKNAMTRITTSSLFKHILHPQKRAFLIAYSELASTERSVEIAKIHRTMPYYWKRTDPAFKEAWEEAKDVVAHSLEEEATRRAKESSDLLLIFLLKGAMPEKYRERYDHSGTVNVNIALDWEQRRATATLKLEERRQLPPGEIAS